LGRPQRCRAPTLRESNAERLCQPTMKIYRLANLAVLSFVLSIGFAAAVRANDKAMPGRDPAVFRDAVQHSRRVARSPLSTLDEKQPSACTLYGRSPTKPNRELTRSRTRIPPTRHPDFLVPPNLRFPSQLAILTCTCCEPSGVVMPRICSYDQIVNAIRN
jgi:hypothetical protein